MTITGDSARVWWGYHVAITLGSWTVTHEDGTWRLVGTVISQDTYRASQHPLVFAANYANGAWRRRVEWLQIEGQTLTARLGPKESV